MIDAAHLMGTIDAQQVFGIRSDTKLICFFKQDGKISAYIAIDTNEHDGYNDLERMHNVSAAKGSITALVVFLHKKYQVKYRIADTEPLTTEGRDWICKILDQGRGFTITDQNGKTTTSTDVRRSWTSALNTENPTPLSILIPHINASQQVFETWPGILQPMWRYIGGDGSID